MSSKGRIRRRDACDPEQQILKETEIEIRLSSEGVIPKDQVVYVFKEGQYQRVTRHSLVIDLLTLPARVVHKEIVALQGRIGKGEEEEVKVPEGKECSEVGLHITEEMQEIYGSLMSAEQLAKLDTQPNPFNFSERVTQTVRVQCRSVLTQTDPPPGTTFSDTASLSKIYDAYDKDYMIVLENQKKMEKEKEKEEERKREKSGKAPEKKEKSPKYQLGNMDPILPPDPITLPLPPPPPRSTLMEEVEVELHVVKMLERIVSQNIYDEITQDFRYWEDASDEYRQLEGSLLPLWKFSCDRARGLVVSAISWSPTHHDLFVAGYMPDKFGASESEGRICLYTLKNPGIPERLYVTPRGVTSVHFHPSRESVLAAGQNDGTVTVYDARNAASPGRISSCIDTGKHLLPVVQVCCIETDPGQDLSFYSVSQDGRVSQWFTRKSSLKYRDILDFEISRQPSRKRPPTNRANLEGTATCIAIHPDNKDVLLLGVDTGVVFQVCTTNAHHDVTRYRAHLGPVTAVTWNNIYQKVFATCALDWTLKIWLQNHMSPLLTLDLGGSIAGLTWSPFSSTVIVAITDEGRAFVYDLCLRRCHPLCAQNLVQRRRSRLTCLAFSPFQPVVLFGGEKGYLVAFKLSPNLRRMPKEAKGADENKRRKIEICKMERIIAISRG